MAFMRLLSLHLDMLQNQPGIDHYFNPYRNLSLKFSMFSKAGTLFRAK
ncbi:Uncharacterized protein dnm_096400 [Desulfonema magnum]|uniref:Uncharacterized protein n=1 Tax=Desulfonema magnum TaxID=45655 RepID=A0A975GVK0_9BACT|nr:Uncharacterized protein dnm_096400 [Desulfonema magnum]